MKVYLYGGCATRDTFSRKELSGIKIIKYFARTVPASFAEKPFLVIDSSGAVSFKRRVVLDDIEKNFLKIFKNDFDFLIMDFGTTSYTNLFKTKDGGIGTLSSYAKELLSEKKISYKQISCWSEEYLNLHNFGLRLFMDIVIQEKLSKKIIINKIYAVKEYNNGECDNEKKINLINSRLDCIYEALRSEIDGINFINYPESVLVGNALHKWGKGYFHYVDEFYIHQEKELRNILNI